MHILQMVGFGLVATVIATVLRPHAPQFAIMVTMVAGTILLLMVMSYMSKVISPLQDLANTAQLNQGFISTVLKIIGIAYIVEFAAQLARDAQEGALATKIELAGKVGIVILALPIVMSVMNAILHLLP
ncbi:stage III sporulation protein AD [Alicyclobacillaceae bacterium I2511]|nr:stage III sporulation protein AD [Alicyclobacillaceae bacterium I2511]